MDLCDHPMDARDWFDKTLSFRVPATSPAAFAVCCRACGRAFLPYGPSNDDPEEVQEEIKAAEFLAQLNTGFVKKWTKVIQGL